MEAAHSVELMRLLDFYGAMLTDRQHEMLRLRLEEDLSLSEIAEGFGVSRQAVNDALRKAEKTLTEMEQKLRLVWKNTGRCTAWPGRRPVRWTAEMPPGARSRLKRC